jgi:hypothetical protein
MPADTSDRRSTVRSRMMTVVFSLLIAACGNEAKQAAESVSAAASVVSASGKMADAVDEAKRFQDERRQKGDTMPMEYKLLQGMLPPAPDGYTADGGPEGSSTAMAGFAMSEAKQRYVGKARSDGTKPRMEVSIVDFGGSEMGYSMLAMPMMMNISREDDRERMRTVKLGPEHTWASEQYDKQSHEAKLTAVTRYRYVLTVTASEQTGDESAAVTKLTEQLARKFEGK